MTKLDITTQTRAIDAFLPTLQNPLHRRIIENYRRHAILEITGYKDQIFEPEMTVEHPVYFLSVNDQSVTLDGLDQVLTFYNDLQGSEATVMVVADEQLAVADWGFASEAVFNCYRPGSTLPEIARADPDKLYIFRQRVAMHWPYDHRGRMIGEHVYEHAAERELIEVSPDEYITLEEAREKLLPMLRPLPELDLHTAV